MGYKEIKKGTGIKADGTIVAALKELMDTTAYRMPLVLSQSAVERGASPREATRYALNNRFELDLSDPLVLQYLEYETAAEAGENGGVRSSKNEVREDARTSKNEEREEVRTPKIGVSRTPKIEERDSETYKARARSGTEERYEENSTAREYGTVSPSEDQNPFIEGAEDARYQTPHFLAVSRACGRDPKLVDFQLRAKLAGTAVELANAGYSPEQVEQAGKLWPLPVAPTPRQLQNDIGPLLNQKATEDSAPKVSKVAEAEAELARRRAATAAAHQGAQS